MRVLSTNLTVMWPGCSPYVTAIPVVIFSPASCELSGGVQERASVSVGYSVLADAMGLSAGRASEGNPAQTPLEAFKVAEQVSDSFGSATFLSELSLEQAVTLAQYVAGENVKYQLHLSVTKDNAEDFSAALIGTASTGLNLKTESGYFIQALPMAVIPKATEKGVDVTYLIDGESSLGGMLRLDSKYNPALNGDYIIEQLKFDIASHDDPFFYQATCKRA